jgi:hypothetical protein
MEIVVIAYSGEMQMWYEKRPSGGGEKYFAILLYGGKKL